MIEYWKKPGLNSTLLGSFAMDPCYAVRSIGNKTYFQDGKAFEDLFEQTILSNSKFDNKFFVADVKVPESLMEVWSDRPDKEKTKRVLSESYVYNKDGKTLNGKKENFHNCLDLILDNDCKYPIDTVSYDNMTLCVERMMNMKIVIRGNVFYFGDLLNEKVSFQYPIFWKDHGDIEKKALLDILVQMEGLDLHFDLKYMASLSAFESSFRNVSARYVLQSMHYSEGMMYHFGHESTINQMIFVVATKQDPYLVRPYMIDEDFIERCQMYYGDLCIECDKWIKDNKPITGVKEVKFMKIWS